MLNFSKNDYPKPADHLIVALAKKLPGAIERNYKAGIEPGEYRTRFYNVSKLIQLLTETGDGVSEGQAVYAIQWLVEQGLLIPIRDALRDPNADTRYGLTDLPPGPWLSAALNGRLLDTVSKFGPPDSCYDYWLKRLEETESEAYFAPKEFWEWWEGFTPDVDKPEIVAGDEIQKDFAIPAPESEAVGFAVTEPVAGSKWHRPMDGPIRGKQSQIIAWLRSSIDPTANRKNLLQRYQKGRYYIMEASTQDLRIWFRSPKEHAEVNQARLESANSSEEKISATEDGK